MKQSAASVRLLSPVSSSRYIRDRVSCAREQRERIRLERSLHVRTTRDAFIKRLTRDHHRRKRVQKATNVMRHKTEWERAIAGLLGTSVDAIGRVQHRN